MWYEAFFFQEDTLTAEDKNINRLQTTKGFVWQPAMMDCSLLSVMLSEYISSHQTWDHISTCVSRAYLVSSRSDLTFPLYMQINVYFIFCLQRPDVL